MLIANRYKNMDLVLGKGEKTVKQKKNYRENFLIKCIAMGAQPIFVCGPNIFDKLTDKAQD